jgi:hypothetical protein
VAALKKAVEQAQNLNWFASRLFLCALLRASHLRPAWVVWQ